MLAAPIRTDRLDLVPMTPEFLEATLRGDRPACARLIGAAVPGAWPEETGFVQLRLGELRADPTLQAWLLRAVVRRDERRMVGHVGFHARPGAAYLAPLSPGGVELGYTIFEADRRRGYAREACTGLMRWAHRRHGATRFVVSIAPANVASLALARALGFRRIGAHVDEEDGPEDVFERRVDADGRLA